MQHTTQKYIYESRREEFCKCRMHFGRAPYKIGICRKPHNWSRYMKIVASGFVGQVCPEIKFYFNLIGFHVLI